MPLLLSEKDIQSLLSMDDLIDAMQIALVQFSSGKVRQPLRTVLEVGAQQSVYAVMPAVIANPPALGTKLVTVFPQNVDVGLPSHLASIVLLDPSTGALLAVMDGRFITEARTAAVSAVSTRLLALEEAGTLAIIGSGVQARSHLEALRLVRSLRQVRVWSPNEERRKSFVLDMAPHAGAPIIATASPREAVDGASLIVLATASREPVIRSDWVRDGAHICAVGACRPDQREMDTALVQRARVFVDSRTGAMAEAGDLVLPMTEGAFTAGHIAGELGELAAGRVPGRQSLNQVTLFKSLGMAVEDVAAAHLAYERATARGLGRGFVL
ncbi:MAG: ornithine cyclodeaminase family protein [Acidobacteria bacterium]|nr:ornithine cyclodeaminase family protein [Acidobacteriota bacterium]MCA1651846.1 ornithine cyclodeaminase family protein [Acidobacteriota bacterium]